MTILAAVLTGLIALGMLGGGAAAAFAPLGYQDERGFHYGAPETPAGSEA